MILARTIPSRILRFSSKHRKQLQAYSCTAYTRLLIWVIWLTKIQSWIYGAQHAVSAPFTVLRFTIVSGAELIRLVGYRYMSLLADPQALSSTGSCRNLHGWTEDSEGLKTLASSATSYSHKAHSHCGRRHTIAYCIRGSNLSDAVRRLKIPQILYFYF
jgi:hypothetical protein